MTDELPAKAPDVDRFKLGEWVVEPSSNRLRGKARSVRLEPRMMHILVCLAARPGEVLDRHQLLETVWADGTVGEETLTRAVSRLRDLLGDDVRAPRFIETIHGGGYCLVAVPGAVHASATVDTEGVRLVKRMPRGAAYFLGLLAVGMLAWVVREQAVDPVSPTLEPRYVTNLPGTESHPDFSPDGRTLAFAWSGHEDERAGIFLVERTGADLRRLTTSPGRDLEPEFSPDGSRVAFVRDTGSGHAIYEVPVTGGEPRHLSTISTPIHGMSWGGEGEGIVFAATGEDDGVNRLHHLDPASLEVSRLTDPDLSTHRGDTWPLQAPGRGSLVFTRYDHAGLRQLWQLDASGSEGRLRAAGMNDVQGLAWLPGGHDLVVSAAPTGRSGLWRVSMADSTRTPLLVGQPGALRHPTVSPTDGAIAYSHEIRNYDLQRVAPGEDPSPFQVSTRAEFSADWSPDGERVVFVTDRTGHPELWLSSARGQGMRRLSDWGGPGVIAPRWHPDGTRVAVTLQDETGNWIEDVDVDVDNGRTTTLLRGGRNLRACGWSADGSLLYLLQEEGEVWRLHSLAAGADRPEPLEVRVPGHPYPRPLADGFVYQDPFAEGIWFFASGDAAPRKLLDGADVVNWRAWDTRGAEIFAAVAMGDEVRLVAINPETGARRELGVLPPGTVRLATAPADDTVLVTILNGVRADLMVTGGDQD